MKGSWKKIAYLMHITNLASVAQAIGTGKLPNCTTISEALGVTPRTVHRHIATLRMFGAPIVYVEDQHGFRFKHDWDFYAALNRWLKRQQRPAM